MNFNKRPLGEVIKALNEIKNNPNHKYTDEEVLELMAIDKEFEDLGAKLKESMKFIAQNVAKAFEAFSQYLYSQFEPVIGELQKVSHFGWYISPNVIRDYDWKTLKEIANSNDIEKFENLILENSDKLIVNSIQRCIKEFPEREALFNDILKSYENQIYSAVILLCYSQVDGMCNKEWNFGFFDKDKDSGHQLKVHTELSPVDFGISSIFARQLGITQNEITIYSKDAMFKDDSKKNSSFNRHLVFHGHSYLYATKKNAVRAMLLLDFVNHFIKLKKEKLS
jgi:hypothetical protein